MRCDVAVRDDGKKLITILWDVRKLSIKEKFDFFRTIEDASKLEIKKTELEEEQANA